MADAYCDYAAGSDSNDGSTWALAKLTTQAAITVAGAAGRVFVRSDATQTNKDSTAGSRTLTGSTAVDDGVMIIGCVSTTTAEPPTEANICSPGDASMPVYSSTASGTLTLVGAATVIGMEFAGFNRVSDSTDTKFAFRRCDIAYAEYFFPANITTRITLESCILQVAGTGTGIIARGSTILLLDDIDFTGSATNYALITPGTGQESFQVTVKNSDLSGHKAGLSSASVKGKFLIANCRLPTSYTVTAPIINGEFELVGCSTGGAATLGTGASAQNYKKVTTVGTVDVETTVVRTGGADDGATGTFSYAMASVSGANAPGSRAVALVTPPLMAWVEGDGTSKTVTVHLTTSATLTDCDVWMSVGYPSEDGSYKYTEKQSTRSYISDNAATLTSDAAQTWGGSTTNDYKISASIAPDYEGPIYVEVFYSKRSTDILYVDPMLDIT